jgi:hypothetical protein
MLKLNKLLRGPVRGAVIDKYQFIRLIHLHQNALEPAVKLMNTLFFVVTRNNYANRYIPARLAISSTVARLILGHKSSPCISNSIGFMQPSLGFRADSGPR